MKTIIKISLMSVVIAMVGPHVSVLPGATIIVDPNDPIADFNNIQEAIDFADDFDTIVVNPGVYYEHINFIAKAITVTSTDPNDPNVVGETIIDGDGSGNVVTFKNAETQYSVLSGVTVTNGERGIYCKGTHTQPRIEKCVIHSNSLGIVGDSSLKPIPTVIECSIRENANSGISYCGGEFLGCTISENSSHAIHYSDGELRDCIITGNGAYAVSNYQGHLAGCTISDNGGGIYLGSGISAVVENCEITDNGSRGVYTSGGGTSVTLKDCVISRNADNGVHSAGSGSSNVANCIISGNGYKGIEIRFGSVINCIIVGNGDSGIDIPVASAVVTVANTIIVRNVDYGVTGSLSATAILKYNNVWANDAGSYNNIAPGENDIEDRPWFARSGLWGDDGVWNDGDYHLKSEAGRWDPDDLIWVQDSISSPCIDTGDPNTCIGFEPNPNGGVVNMGIYGGTAEASLSPSGINCISDDHQDYDEWVKVGEPVCWCYPRQCHGDTDCKSQGKQKYWVSTDDLDVLIAAWCKPFDEIEGQKLYGLDLVCADFDHKAQGKRKYRACVDDLDILIANWSQADSPDPNCP